MPACLPPTACKPWSAVRLSRGIGARHTADDVTAERLRLIVQRRHHRGRVLPTMRSGGVVGAQTGLEDGQGALVKGAGSDQVALVGQDASQVVQRGGSVRVVGTLAGLTGDQGTLQQRTSRVEVALIG